jgi:hypothetical protein
MPLNRKFMTFIDKFIDALVDAGSERYYQLEHPAPEQGEDVAEHRHRAEQLAKKWCETVRLETGTPGFARALVTQAKSDGSVWFHILIAGCDWGKFKKVNYCFNWYEETTGRATQQRLDLPRLAAEMHFLVMKLDCPIDVSTPFLSPKVDEAYVRMGIKSFAHLRDDHAYRSADFWQRGPLRETKVPV